MICFEHSKFDLSATTSNLFINFLFLPYFSTCDLVNVDTNGVIGNMTIAKLGSNGRLRVYSAHAVTDVVIDVTAVFL